MSFFHHKQTIPALFYIKAGILLFWGVWFSIAVVTNIFDFLYGMLLLPADWHFRSGDYVMVHDVLNIYSTPLFFLNLFFCLDILVQGTAAVLFFCAAKKFICKRRLTGLVNVAFAVSMGLWAIFILMDEFFIAYSYEHNHHILLGFELLTFLSLYLLPDSIKD